MKALAAVKLKNQLLKLDPTLDVQLKNVRVNGALFGCSGFVVGPEKIVYVNTDHNHGMNTLALYRVARDTKDYTGEVNRYAGYDELAFAVAALAKGAVT